MKQSKTPAQQIEMARFKDIHRPPADQVREIKVMMIGVFVPTIVIHGLLSKLHQIGEEA